MIDKEGNEVKGKLNKMDVFMWKENWKIAKDLNKKFTKFQKTAYPLVIRQCSPALRAQLEGMKGYESINTNQNIVEVLN